MRIVHQLQKNIFEQEVWQGQANGSVGFLTANRMGDYACFFNEPQSRYNGWFVRNGENLFKIVENIALNQPWEILELKNEFFRHTRQIKTKQGIIQESFFLPENNHGLVYETSQITTFDLFLDFKPIFNNNESERFYKIEIKGKIAFIECQNQKEKNFLAIKTDFPNISLIENWVKRNYQDDVQRNSPPFERYVFWALQIRGSKMALAVAATKDHAQKEVNLVFNKTWKFKKEKKKIIAKAINTVGLKNKDALMAYYCSQNALRELVVQNQNQKHIIAGLPWFFDIWTRDELISLKQFSRQADLFWKICFNYFNLIGDNGLLPNKLNNKAIQSADGIGWLFFQIGQVLERKKINEITVWKIKKTLEKTLGALGKSFANKDLAVCFGNDTWMDSISRSGARLEIQALYLYMLKLSRILTNNPLYVLQESNLKFKVKEQFWNGKFLFDSPSDQTIRPNIFLAAYIYPELLEKNEWQTCFDNALQALWLDWGGLATIDKSSFYYCPNHTGEKSQSYHSGDSWFYLNNLAAIVLQKNNPERYRVYIDKILQASANEILSTRAIGCHSELSSAANFSPQGCLSQAWSNALFAELIQTISKF